MTPQDDPYHSKLATKIPESISRQKKTVHSLTASCWIVMRGNLEYWTRGRVVGLVGPARHICQPCTLQLKKVGDKAYIDTRLVRWRDQYNIRTSAADTAR